MSLSPCRGRGILYKKFLFAAAAAQSIVFYPIAQNEKSGHIGKDHQLVEHILQSPDQITFDQRTQDNETERKQYIQHKSLFPEKIVKIDPAEIVPA